MGTLYPHKQRRIFYKADDVEADTWVILADLSDYSNYKWPSQPNGIIVLGIDIATEKASDGRYDIHVGVVKENDATNGSAQWIKSWFLNADGNATESTDRFVDKVSFVYPDSGVDDQGVDCSVDSSATRWVVGTASGDQTALQNDAANLASARGGSSLSAAAGDIVMFIDEGTSGGTISVAIGLDYVVV